MFVWRDDESFRIDRIETYIDGDLVIYKFDVSKSDESWIDDRDLIHPISVKASILSRWPTSKKFSGSAYLPRCVDEEVKRCCIIQR